MSQQRTVFVTGATGYIGGRLVLRLLDAGFRVRCLAREIRKIEARSWARRTGVEIVEGDVSDVDRLASQMKGCVAAYYLIHSMMAVGREYADRDRQLAGCFARASEAARVERIVYLGGLGESGAGLSEHLSSRREVEAALSSTGVPVTVFRAAMIVGAGSASFEILRYLVERLPVMVTPSWIETESQPIAVSNVLHYLVACLEVPETVGRTLDIGGADVLSYRQLMEVMALERGLQRRFVIPVPLLTPRLSSLWIHLVTPLSSRIARPLAEGLRNRVVCRNDDAALLIPQRLLTAQESIRAALGQLKDNEVETSWSDAGPLPGDPDWSGGTVFSDRRSMELRASAANTFKSICRLGGGNGWYAAEVLWRIRGFLDRLVGGPGLNRGRRHPQEVGFGDAIDFWRVVKIQPDRRLELMAEMKLPGEARLEFSIERSLERPDQCRLTQTARFKPRGLSGLLYWFAVLPFHYVVFHGMLTGIKRFAESMPQDSEMKDAREGPPEGGSTGKTRPHEPTRGDGP